MRHYAEQGLDSLTPDECDQLLRLLRRQQSGDPPTLRTHRRRAS